MRGYGLGILGIPGVVGLLLGSYLAVRAAHGAEEEVEGDLASLRLVNLSYYAVFFGPSLKDPSSYQPDSSGIPDPNRPVTLKNFLDLSYSLTQQVGVGGVAYWTWQPALKQAFQLQDPFLRIYHNSLIHTDHFNLYADFRAHFPITSGSRDSDLLFGAQSFQSLSYAVGHSRLLMSLFTSERTNFFGTQGVGSDFELYVAPNLTYQVAQGVALNLLYEVQSIHGVGQESGLIFSDAGLEPGVSWEALPRLSINPYLHIPTGGGRPLSSTTFGLFLSLGLIE